MPTWEEDQGTPEVHRGLLVRSPQSSPSGPSGSEGQQRRMMAALGILAVALILVVIKDWQLWFPSSPSSPAQVAENAPTDDGETEITTTGVTGGHASAAARPRQKMPAIPASGSPQDSSVASAGPTITATQRTVLPPLEVEVVAGGERRTVEPHNNSVKVDMQSEPSAPAVPVLGSAGQVSTDVAASVHLSPETAQVLSRPVEPSYPLLAKQMKVQGAVVLEALIGKQGAIEDLRVLSGPAILSSAAMEAVKQWRFKPYFQNGRPVETQARITVNFTISTY